MLHLKLCHLASIILIKEKSSAMAFNYGLVVVLTFVLVQVATSDKCGPTSEYRFCNKACGPTCAVPHPIRLCPQTCESGCFCKEGYLRNENNECVPSKDCARSTADKCLKETEEFQECAGCDDQCDDDDKQQKICNRMCAPGCACKKGLVRDSKQRCIPKTECKKDGKLCVQNFFLAVGTQKYSFGP